MTGIIAVPGVVSGRDATLIRAVVAGIVPEIRAQFDAEIAPIKAENAALRDRIDALEKRELQPPEKGERGEPGPQGEPGPAGEVDMGAVRDLVDQLTQQAVSGQLAEAVKAIPAPEPVEPVAPDMEAIAKLVQDGIAKAVGELPPPEKGEPGIGLTGAMIDREGELVLTLSNGETRNVGRVVGKDGESPPPFTLDDFDIVPTNERAIEMSFTQGDVKHTFELAFPVLIGRGIWNAEEDYERGDVTTWGGTAWEAVEPEKGVKPDLSKGGWRILAKRGRDGKDAK